LRHLSQERAKLQVTMARGGSSSSDVDMRGARKRWIQTTHILADAGELLDLSMAERDTLYGPLQKSVAEAARTRPPADPGDIGDNDADNDDDNGDNAPAGDDTVERPAAAFAAAPVTAPQNTASAQQSAAPAQQ
jgi:hypothetical protein